MSGQAVFMRCLHQRIAEKPIVLIRRKYHLPVVAALDDVLLRLAWDDVAGRRAIGSLRLKASH